VFVGGIAATAVLSSRHAGAITIVGGGLALAAFVGLVARHRRLSTIARLHDALARGCEAGAARVMRDWARMPPAATPAFSASHPFAIDLNLFGEVSLARLLGPTSAVAGRTVIHRWLLAESPPSLSVLRDRQRAIAELAQLVDWRERLGVLGSRAGHRAESLESFLQWAETDETLVGAARSWIARALAVVTILALAFALTHPASVGWIVTMAAINIVFTMAARADLRRGLEAAAARGFSLETIAAMFAHAGTARFETDALRDLEQRMEPRDAGAFASLARIAHWGELRHSPMAHGILQVVVLWDFHVVHALDRWRARHGRAVRPWMEALGELEACASLATLAHDNPSWVFPEFAESGSTSIETIGLAHPLLPAATRVANDVTVGPRDTFLLITGSNMAGKSTLLRSIGLNALLAELGSPVCAASFRMPPVRVRTSIQIRDAIEQGLSLFMAEVLRLKAIVDAARVADGPMLLYLGDEMLHGTNTEERRIAVVAVISHLLGAGAIGAVATHDVELSSDPVLAAHARPIYFVEQFRETEAGPEMWFDYQLRPGLATSRNALKLIALVGLVPK
jgi:hypothetical protein